jgi:hypothetical protein
MANHVMSNITVRNPTSDVVEFISSLFTKEEGGYNYDIDLNKLYENTEGSDTRQWYIDNIGAKWMTIDDVGGDYFNTVTAWSAPIDFFEVLCLKLQSIQPDVQVSMTYEDEMPNFIGVSVFDGDMDEFDNTELDSEDYSDVLGVSYPDEEEIAEDRGLDLENDYDEIDEIRYELQEEFWEKLHEFQNDFVTDFFANNDGVIL